MIASNGNDTDWQENMDAGKSAFEGRRFAEAQKFFGLALKAAESFDEGDMRLAHTLYELAYSLSCQLKSLEAEPVFKRALTAKELSAGIDDLELIPYLDGLAQVHFDRNNYTDAIALHQRALTISEKALGKNHLQTLQRVSRLVHSHKKAGANGSSRELEMELQQRMRYVLDELNRSGASQAELIAWLRAMAQLYLEMDLFTEAEPLYKRVVELKELSLGPIHQDLADFLDEMAFSYSAHAKYRQAEELFQRAIKIRESLHGENHPNVIGSLKKLSQMYRRQNRSSQAKELCLRIVEITEASPDSNYEDLRAAHTELALLLMSEKDTAAEAIVYRHVLEIIEQKVGADHFDAAEVMIQLANLPCTAANEAEELYKKALSIQEKHYGPDHPALVNTLSYLASHYYRQQKLKWAEPLYERALTIGEQTQGRENSAVLSSMANVGRVYFELGKDVAAESVLNRALGTVDGLIAAGGKAPWPMNSILNTLARLNTKRGDYATAELPYKRHLAATSSPGRGHQSRSLIEDLTCIGIVCQRQHKYTEAEPYYQRALEVLEKEFDPKLTSTISFVLKSYISLLKETNRHPEAEKFELELKELQPEQK
jgi:hypothetical protein